MSFLWGYTPVSDPRFGPMSFPVAVPLVMSMVLSKVLFRVLPWEKDGGIQTRAGQVVPPGQDRGNSPPPRQESERCNAAGSMPLMVTQEGFLV